VSLLSAYTSTLSSLSLSQELNKALVEPLPAGCRLTVSSVVIVFVKLQAKKFQAIFDVCVSSI